MDYCSEKLYHHTLSMLRLRGVTLESLAKPAYDNQSKYVDITLDDAVDAVKDVLHKNEVINAVLTAIELDRQAERNQIIDPYLQEIITNDESLYGIDEILALSITNIFGSIALTNFGYLDKVKHGIAKKLDTLGKEKINCMTFLDDVASAIIAGASSKLAHSHPNKESIYSK